MASASPIIHHEKAGITAAELKTIRESLGLTFQWIANIAKVQLRTVQYWEAGRMAVPIDVSKQLGMVDQLLDDMVAEAYKGYVKILIDQYAGTIEVPLVRYRTEKDLWKYEKKMKGLPLSTYAMYLSRLQNLLRSQGVASFTGFIDIVDYNKFIKKEKRKDSSLERALWIGNHYGKMGEAGLRGALFSKFLQLSTNNPLKEGFNKTLTNEFLSQVLDEISNYEYSAEPRLKLLAFHLYYEKYKIYQDESIRKKALELSLHSLWKLGKTLTEQLCFGGTIKPIFQLCLKDNNFQESDFKRYIISPIHDLFSDKKELCTENLQKIVLICDFLISLELNSEQLGVSKDKKFFKNVAAKAKEGIFHLEGSMIECASSFLKKHQLWNERIQNEFDRKNPQFRAKKALENMQWHSFQAYVPISTINRSSLKNYLASCKELINDYVHPIGNDLPFLSSTSKIYQKESKVVLGDNPENFHIFLSKSLLSRHLMISDLSLTAEQTTSFIGELQKTDLNIYFVLEKQRYFLIESLKYGFAENYLAAAFLLMPYIENLIRVRAQENGWKSSDERGEYRTPNQEAFNLFLKGMGDNQKQLCRILYTVIYDVPNTDATKTDRIGDNLRNESLHGLIEDLEIFGPNRQVQFKMIWLIMSILTLA